MTGDIKIYKEQDGQNERIMTGDIKIYKEQDGQNERIMTGDIKIYKKQDGQNTYTVPYTLLSTLYLPNRTS